LDGGYSLQYSPLLEYREGGGMVLFCQMDVTGRTDDDPAADRLARNLLSYVSAWKPGPRRQAIYTGDPAGRRYLEAAGISLASERDLTADRVLIVGPGGAPRAEPRVYTGTSPAKAGWRPDGKLPDSAGLLGRASQVRDWLNADGHVLAVGLDEADANAFLP